MAMECMPKLPFDTAMISRILSWAFPNTFSYSSLSSGYMSKYTFSKTQSGNFKRILNSATSSLVLRITYLSRIRLVIPWTTDLCNPRNSHNVTKSRMELNTGVPVTIQRIGDLRDMILWVNFDLGLRIS